MLVSAGWLSIFDYAFMRNAFMAGTLVAVTAGIVGYFVVLRRLAFAGHALAHIGFAGATGAVFLNLNLFVGLAVFTTGAGIAMGMLGDKVRGRDVAIGTVLALTMGLGTCSSACPARSTRRWRRPRPPAPPPSTTACS